MQIWDGAKKDTSNFKSDKFLNINNCGFQNPDEDLEIIREKGRLDYQLILMVKGRCKAEIFGEVYNLTKGNIIIYPPYEKQRYCFSQGSSSLWCHFSGTVADEILKDCNLQGGVYDLSPDKAIFDAFSKLVQRFYMPGKLQFANAEFLKLVYTVAERLTSGESESSNVLLPVLAYINANYNKEITLDHLAKKSGYSKSRFSHLFLEVTGTTPKKYQNNVRLNASCEMLLSMDKSVGEIAILCGFSDQLYYSRIFKKHFGISPREYRNKKEMYN